MICTWPLSFSKFLQNAFSCTCPSSYNSSVNVFVDCRTNAAESSIVCRLCIEEDTVGEESYLKQDEVCEYTLSTHDYFSRAFNAWSVNAPPAWS